MAEIVEHLYNKEYKGKVIIDDKLKAAIDAYYDIYGDKVETVGRKMKLGRNDICWCGSGKKYKSCHLNIDSKLEENEAKGI